jgi:hypothetical protein
MSIQILFPATRKDEIRIRRALLRFVLDSLYPAETPGSLGFDSRKTSDLIDVVWSASVRKHKPHITRRFRRALSRAMRHPKADGLVYGSIVSGALPDKELEVLL